MGFTANILSWRFGHLREDIRRANNFMLLNVTRVSTYFSDEQKEQWPPLRSKHVSHVNKLNTFKLGRRDMISN